MNGLQLAQQIQARLRAAVWPTGTQGKVFQLVKLHAGQVTAKQFPQGNAWALVATQDFRPDPQTPFLGQQEISVFYVAASLGDTQGGLSVSGGPVTDLGSSSNRGIEELHPIVAAACTDLHGADGAELIVTGGRRAGNLPFGDAQGKIRHMVLGRTDAEALCSVLPYYAPPEELNYQPAGKWTWEGAHCAARYDFQGYELYEHTQLEGILESGTQLYAGTTPSFTVGLPTAGRYYAVVANYSSRGRADLIEGQSELDRGSWIRWE